MELGPVLQVVGQRDFAGGSAAAGEVAGEEGRHHAWEDEFGLQAIFLVIFVLIALKSGNGLEGGTQLYAEHLGTAEEVAILVSERRCGTEVACGVGALRLEGQRGRLVHRELNVAIQKAVALGGSVGQRVGRHLGVADVCVLHGLQAREVIVSALQVGTAEGLSGLYGSVVLQRLAAQSASQEAHVAHGELRMLLFGRGIVGAVACQMERQVDKVAA